MKFSEFWLKAGLLKSLEHIWYAEATPIQEKVMKIAFSGKNIVWQSQTWTGKTAAFLLPVLNQIDTNHKALQVLILVPTRELATQVEDEIRNLTKFYSVTSTALYGGASPNVQKQKLKRKPAIVVATPGRLMDFMNQWVINVSTVSYFILDEVDMMLDMGFVRDIEKVWAKMKDLKQIYTFSATMNNDMKAVIKRHISSYEFLKVWDAVTVDKINHRYVSVEHEHKLSNVLKLIDSHSKDKIIIFTHTKRNTKIIQKILIDTGINAGMLNGNMWQGKRQWTLNEFKAWKLQVLVTTDVAARGLNMENVWLVINFDVPVDAKSYIHRIGRTWRAGAHGKAVMLVSNLEKWLVDDIEKLHRIKIEESDHRLVYDVDWKHVKIRLNRSTDKLWKWRAGGKWWKRPEFSSRSAPKRKSYNNRDKDNSRDDKPKRYSSNTSSSRVGESSDDSKKSDGRREGKYKRYRWWSRSTWEGREKSDRDDSNRKSKPSGRRLGRKR